MKRTIALILAVLAVLASAVMAFADEPPMLIATHDPIKLPFKAYSLGGKLLDKAVKEEQAYTYTNWSNAAFSVDLYTIVVPEGTEAVKLSFDSEKLCYNYAFTGEGAASVTDADYLSGAVADENTQDGQISFTVPLDSKLVNYDGTTAPADGVIDFVQIQTPYDAEWNTSVLYAVTFKTEPVTSDNISALFGDVAADAEYAEAVAWAVGKDITAGTGNGNFGTGKTITREQMVTFLWNMAGQPKAAEGTENFSDVAADKWYAEPIAWAKEKKVSAGMGNNVFGVGKTLTRQQVVWFLSNYTGKTVEEIDALVPADNNREDVVCAIYNLCR